MILATKLLAKNSLYCPTPNHLYVSLHKVLWAPLNIAKPKQVRAQTTLAAVFFLVVQNS